MGVREIPNEVDIDIYIPSKEKVSRKEKESIDKARMYGRSRDQLGSYNEVFHNFEKEIIEEGNNNYLNIINENKDSTMELGGGESLKSFMKASRNKNVTVHFDNNNGKSPDIPITRDQVPSENKMSINLSEFMNNNIPRTESDGLHVANANKRGKTLTYKNAEGERVSVRSPARDAPLGHKIRSEAEHARKNYKNEEKRLGRGRSVSR